MSEISMGKKDLRFVFMTSLLTALTVGGSLVPTVRILRRADILFFTGHVLESTTLGLSALILLPAIGGGLWGLGLSRLVGVEKKGLAKSAALTLMVSVLIVNFTLVGLSIVIPDESMRPMQVTIMVAILFGVCAALLAAFNTRKLIRNLGFENLMNSAGLKAGIATFLGFILFHFLMHLLGWRLGDPTAFKEYKMTTVLMVNNLGASLAAGAMIGWVLATERMSFHEAQLPVDTEA